MPNRITQHKVLAALGCALALVRALPAQTVVHAGTICAQWLNQGSGGPAGAMGDALAAVPGSLASLSGNPAHLGLITGDRAAASHMVFGESIGHTSLSAGTDRLKFANLSVGVMQAGKSLRFRGQNEWSLSLALARRFGRRISGGAALKSVSYSTGIERLHAVAWDAGILVTPPLPSARLRDRLNIGFSIANGTLYQEEPKPVMTESEQGFAPVEVSSDLPLRFRIGLACTLLDSRRNRLIAALDAVHPNDDPESLNLGFQDRIVLGNRNDLFLRAGYRRFSDGEEDRLSAGFGLLVRDSRAAAVELGYSWMQDSRASDRHGVYIQLSTPRM